MHLVDRDGSVVLSLKSKTFSAHNKWYIYSGRNTDKENKIATVKPQSGSIFAEVSLYPVLLTYAPYATTQTTTPQQRLRKLHVVSCVAHKL